MAATARVAVDQTMQAEETAEGIAAATSTEAEEAVVKAVAVAAETGVDITEATEDTVAEAGASLLDQRSSRALWVKPQIFSPIISDSLSKISPVRFICMSVCGLLSLNTTSRKVALLDHLRIN